MTNTITVTSPFSGETLGKLPTAGVDKIEEALSGAYSLYRNRSEWLPKHQRISILEKLSSLMSEQIDALALLAASEGGKPLKDSLVEVNRAIDGVRLAIITMRSEAGHVIPMGATAASFGRSAFTQKEPIGVVVAVSAFNHPLNLIVHQVIPAIAVGCPVIIKPAKSTPLSCRKLVDLLYEAGLPEPWCQLIIPENNQLSEAMVVDSRVGFFSFIGSAGVGWMLKSKLAPGARCALEHGGVAPLIVASDADLDKAVPAVAKGGFYHAGQVCVSVQRVYVHSSIVERFSERLVEAAKKMTVGDPCKEQTDVGPLITPNELKRVSEWVDEASISGQVLCGGKELDGNCYAPTVVLNPGPDTKLSTDEVFGPVVCIYSYDDLSSAISAANSLAVSFQAAVFTQDIDTAMTVYRGIDASSVMLNDHTAFRTDEMPFAGLRQSGMGVGGIPHTISDMQIEKMLVINSPEAV